MRCNAPRPSSRPLLRPLGRPALLQLLLLSCAGIAAALGCGLPRAALAAEPAPIGVVAPGDCWRPVPASADGGLARHLARCAALGADMLRLQVRASADGAVNACATDAACAPLPEVLGATPAPALLLDTPTALLDAVQQAVSQAGAAARVKVAPQFVRPVASAAPQALAPGVRYWAERREQPRPIMLHVVEIDLSQAGPLEFATTPPLSLPADPAAAPGSQRFAVQKTSEHARQAGWLVAVNASYFLPFDGGRLMVRPYVPQPGTLASVAPAWLDGTVRPQGDTALDPRADGMVCLVPGGFAISAGLCPAGSTPAFAAGPVLLQDGRRLPLKAHEAGQRPDASGIPQYFRSPEPRTALGLDPAGRRAWMVVVDGRQSGYSEGMTVPELAALFESLGARDAINLDGGGSSTLALSGAVANSPIHTSIPGRERPVANHFGLRLLAPAPNATQAKP